SGPPGRPRCAGRGRHASTAAFLNFRGVGSACDRDASCNRRQGDPGPGASSSARGPKAAMALNDVKLVAGEHAWSLAGQAKAPAAVRPGPVLLVAVAIAVDALLVIGSFTVAQLTSSIQRDGLGSPISPDYNGGQD